MKNQFKDEQIVRFSLSIFKKVFRFVRILGNKTYFLISKVDLPQVIWKLFPKKFSIEEGWDLNFCLYSWIDFYICVVFLIGHYLVYGLFSLTFWRIYLTLFSCFFIVQLSNTTTTAGNHSHVATKKPRSGTILSRSERECADERLIKEK